MSTIDLFRVKDLDALKVTLDKVETVFITTHPRPDADALGSSLAIANYLKKKGKIVHVVTPTAYPDFIAWMKGNDDVLIYEGNETKAKSLLDESDCVFCLDFSALNRIGELGELIRNSSATKILIDHHIGAEDFDDFRLWEVKASATAELIYDFIVQLGDDNLIDKDIAEAIYAGIMTDTGSFRFPATTSKVHRIIANLIDKGMSNSEIHRLVYDNNQESKMRFLGYCLSEKLVVRPAFNSAYIVISLKDKERFDAQLGDTEGIVNYALSIKGVKFASLIKEEKDSIKFSFRSVGDFCVNAFARKYFNGGGHTNAAGGRSDDTLENTVEKFDSLLEVCKDQIKKA